MGPVYCTGSYYLKIIHILKKKCEFRGHKLADNKLYRSVIRTVYLYTSSRYLYKYM